MNEHFIGISLYQIKIETHDSSLAFGTVIKCYECVEIGHNNVISVQREKFIGKRKSATKNKLICWKNTVDEDDVAFMYNNVKNDLSVSDSDIITFYLDFGALNHLISNKSYLSNIKFLEESIKIDF